MKPFTAYQSTINDEVLRSLDALGQMHSDLKLLVALRQPLLDRLDALDQGLQVIRAEQRAVPFMSGSPFGTSHHPIAGVVQGYESGHGGTSSDAYRSFEDIFRGSEDFIRERQQVFLELIGVREPVLDFGCGRGEFLDLLLAQGRPYLGVDSDAGMVARCMDKGHDGVVLADGLDYLGQLEAGSIGAIFCAQVIEHLPYDELLRFFALARHVLADDGMLIAETVNPHSPQALKTFWVDLTHQHPVFPEVALALCQSSGFSEAFVFHPNGTGAIEVDRYVQGEYAVVARAGDGPQLQSPADPEQLGP